ncbi:MAG: zinc finger CDGSH-type domain protein [Ignavibacteria bacterium]|nr:zinc finger CDGSH-type domain protein [Ignavibacteria bacterium]
MSEPIIAQKSSYKVELEAKKYFWCACGGSKNQPFCDSKHKTTDIKPIIFEIETPGLYSLCGCKHSENKPFCDHTHRTL